MTNIIRRSHGFQLDHIGLGVPDTKDGVKWVEEKTGAKVDDQCVIGVDRNAGAFGKPLAEQKIPIAVHEMHGRSPALE